MDRKFEVRSDVSSQRIFVRAQDMPHETPRSYTFQHLKTVDPNTVTNPYELRAIEYWADNGHLFGV